MGLSSHQTRMITAAALLIALAAVLFFGGWTLRLAVALVACLGLYELFAMYWPKSVFIPRKAAGMALGALLVCSQAGGSALTLAVLGLAFCAVGLLFLFDYGQGNTEARLGHYGPILHGLLYIPLLLQLALYLTTAEQIMVLIAAIASDTGAFYAGSRLGRRKLWEPVSPKKTWEGFFGGMAACVAACTAFALLARLLAWPISPLPLWLWPLAACLLNLASVFGDLFESALKRSLGVKDSGILLPGHGGILDRIDSLLFVLPVYSVIRLIAATAAGA